MDILDGKSVFNFSKRLDEKRGLVGKAKPCEDLLDEMINNDKIIKKTAEKLQDSGDLDK